MTWKTLHWQKHLKCISANTWDIWQSCSLMVSRLLTIIQWLNIGLFNCWRRRTKVLDMTFFSFRQPQMLCRKNNNFCMVAGGQALRNLSKVTGNYFFKRICVKRVRMNNLWTQLLHCFFEVWQLSVRRSKLKSYKNPKQFMIAHNITQTGPRNQDNNNK